MSHMTTDLNIPRAKFMLPWGQMLLLNPPERTSTPVLLFRCSVHQAFISVLFQSSKVHVDCCFFLILSLTPGRVLHSPSWRYLFSLTSNMLTCFTLSSDQGWISHWICPHRRTFMGRTSLSCREASKWRPAFHLLWAQRPSLIKVEGADSGESGS